MNSELITLIANIALTLSFIAALIFGIAQTRAAAQDRKERFTLETMRNFQTHEFCQLMYFINNIAMPATRAEMQLLPAKEQVNLIHFAQIMESVGLQVAEKLIDIDLVDKTLGSYVITSWEKYKLMFEDVRKTAPDPFLGEYFQWLAERLDERMAKAPRKPFFERKLE
ncbi:DUF4760 domain-containing protein [Mucilaginibacter arboris]|uniref:DUF4760 domain-containing protein n=1 Tax=Mucilaginibacter arboris TaxID=2682090 RepID=A0A7K1T0T6_9SPHI|nr:hypothetical protein [Mucilaginibacter arboris]MVN23148.1 hypothetical protein [Mucilaginibacter arboris]